MAYETILDEVTAWAKAQGVTEVNDRVEFNGNEVSILDIAIAWAKTYGVTLDDSQ